MSSPAPGWRRLLGLFLREQGKAHPLPDLGVVARGGSPSWFHNNADGSGFEAAAFRLFGSALNAPDFLEGKNTMVGLTALTLAGGAILGLSGLATPAAA